MSSDPIAPPPAHCPACGDVATRATREHVRFDAGLRPAQSVHAAGPCGCLLDATQYEDLLADIFAPPPGWR